MTTCPDDDGAHLRICRVRKRVTKPKHVFHLPSAVFNERPCLIQSKSVVLNKHYIASEMTGRINELWENKIHLGG